MKKIPELLLDTLEGIKGFDRSAFEKVHASAERVTSIRVNPSKLPVGNAVSDPVNALLQEARFNKDAPVPWTKYGYYLLERPSFTFDPLFHAGCYYVQEASSMFLEQAITQSCDLAKPMQVLDLCGAPGGKSTHIQSLLPEGSMLVTNEVIKSRTNILIDNIVKWGAGNVIVTNNDPSAFQKLNGFFDLVVIDAPCSGSGLFRRDEDAIKEWSLNNVQLCSQRQKRILADTMACLKENGILIYSTCSYSREEDEEIGDWLVEEFDLEPVRLNISPEWKIVETASERNKVPGYRFFPDKLKGEGFFLSCFRKITSTAEARIKTVKPEKANTKEKALVENWLNTDAVEILKKGEQLFAWPSSLMEALAVCSAVLNVRQAGVLIGQIMKERLVPEHALALSRIIKNELPSNELNYDDAIRYLQKQDVNFNSEGRGWQLVTYRGHNLGWINVLPNRVNNYYPKELRILKSSEGSSFEKL